MAVVTMRQLLEAGVHFGHQTRRWDPKMEPYIFGDRNGIHIIDLRQTIEQIEQAYAFVRDAVTDGGKVLFVGTKKQAREVVRREAERAQMPYVNHRWLGGMLTNFATIHKRILYMHELERMEESGEMEALPKKERLRLRRERGKLQTVLGGVGDLGRPPDGVFIIDIRTEDIAVKEARRLGIPVVAVVDTNCDPDQVDYVIPGNDDAIRAAQLLASVIADACVEGRELAEAARKDAADRRAMGADALAAAEAASGGGAAAEAASGGGAAAEAAGGGGGAAEGAGGEAAADAGKAPESATATPAGEPEPAPVAAAEAKEQR